MRSERIGIFEKKFDKIKNNFKIGDFCKSKMLSKTEKAQKFLDRISQYEMGGAMSLKKQPNFFQI